MTTDPGMPPGRSTWQSQEPRALPRSPPHVARFVADHEGTRHSMAKSSATPGHDESYWMATTDSTAYAPLTEDAEVDVTVVGGGWRA